MQDFKVDIIGPTGDCAVLRIAGELDAYTAPALRERMRDLNADGAVNVIADMRQVDFLDSTGLGVLIGGLKRFREHGGSLAPVITRSGLLKVLQVTGLTSVLPPDPRSRTPSTPTRTGGRRPRARPEARPNGAISTIWSDQALSHSRGGSVRRA